MSSVHTTRRDLIGGASAALALTAPSARAEAEGDKIRPLVLIS
jgi:hypothetical protein